MVLRSTNLVPLMSGSYKSRSNISDYQVSENVFPEINPEETDPVAPVTHYPREGKRPLSSPPAQGPGRGLFVLSNGALFTVVGSTLYYIDANWVFNKIGIIFDNVSTPVSMSDNGVTAVLVDGTTTGYTVTLNGNVFGLLNDPTGLFVGSRKVDFSDTYLAFAAPGTNEWYVSLSDQVNFNALAQANKDTTPDPIQTFAFNIRQAWLFGTKNTEVWYLAGSTPFPYQEWPNVFVPYGCAAPYSVVKADIDLFWISQNDQGDVIALKTNGYAAMAFSTRALEFEWTKYPTVADVIGSTFQQAGHTFITFTFPTADVTWAYDLATKQWHKRTWIDQNGVAHRERTTFYASVTPSGGYQPTIVGQDWQTGQIYALDSTYYTDNGTPIVCHKTFPHLVKDMHEVTTSAFVADFMTGGLVGTSEEEFQASGWSNGFSSGFGPRSGAIANPNNPALCMRYSKNGGGYFSNYRQKNLITSGHYRSMMRWRGLGMGRDWVFDLLWSYPGPSALQGAYVEQIEHSS